MVKVKKTYKQLQDVDFLVGVLYKENPELEKSKFGYAWKRFVQKNYLKHMKEFQSEIMDVRIDNALEDEKTKALLTDQANPRGYKYSKEGLKAVVKKENAINDKWADKIIEVEPYVIPVESLPTLTEDETEELTGILIAPNEEDIIKAPENENTDVESVDDEDVTTK